MYFLSGYLSFLMVLLFYLEKIDCELRLML